MKRRNRRMFKIALKLTATVSFILMMGTWVGCQFLWSIGFASLLAVSANIMDKMGMLERDRSWTR